jgi:site-specific recombinase XerD
MKNTPQLTLSKLIEGYFLSQKSRRLSEGTLRDYANTFRLACEFLGANTIFSKITKDDIGRFLAAQPVSKKTVYNYHIGLSALWTWAVREGYVDEHIVKKSLRPHPEEPDIIPYTQKDLERMLGVVGKSIAYTRLGKATCSHSLKHADRHRAMLLLLLDTGIRVSELSSLKIHQVDLQNQRINVWGIGIKQRTIPLHPSTCQAIWKYLSARLNDSMGDPVFITDNGKPLTRRRILAIIHNISKRAGIMGANVHRFRHTFAINYLRNGGDIYTLQGNSKVGDGVVVGELVGDGVKVVVCVSVGNSVLVGAFVVVVGITSAIFDVSLAFNLQDCNTRSNNEDKTKVNILLKLLLLQYFLNDKFFPNFLVCINAGN